jgi:hypothetical protein
MGRRTYSALISLNARSPAAVPEEVALGPDGAQGNLK